MTYVVIALLHDWNLYKGLRMTGKVRFRGLNRRIGMRTCSIWEAEKGDGEMKVRGTDVEGQGDGSIQSRAGRRGKSRYAGCDVSLVALSTNIGLAIWYGTDDLWLNCPAVSCCACYTDGTEVPEFADPPFRQEEFSGHRRLWSRWRYRFLKRSYGNHDS